MKMNIVYFIKGYSYAHDINCIKIFNEIHLIENTAIQK